MQIKTYIYIIIFTFLSLNAYNQTLIKTFNESSKAIVNLETSYNSRYLAVSNADKKILIYDLNKMQYISELSDNSDGEVGLSFINDSLLFTGGWDKVVKLWSLNTNNLKRKYINHSASVRSVSSTPNYPFGYSAGWDKNILIWHLASGAFVDSIPAHDECIRAIKISNDASFIASGGYDLYLKIWDTKTKKIKSSIKAHKYPIEAIDISYDSKYIATGSVDNTVKVWNSSNGELANNFEDHSASVYTVSFSPDGHYLASGSNDKTIKIWDLYSGQIINTLEHHTLGVKAIKFTSNGKYLISAGNDKTICVWDVQNLNISEFKNSNTINTQTLNLFEWKSKINNIKIYEESINLNFKLNSNNIKEVFLLRNGIEISKIIPKDNNDIPVKVDLIEGKNEIALKCYFNENIHFSNPISIIKEDRSKFKKGRSLHIIDLSIPYYSDKKINSINDASPFTMLIEKIQRFNLSFENIKVHSLNSDIKSQKYFVDDTLYNICYQNLKQNDLVVIFIDGIIKEEEGLMYFLTSDANLKSLENSSILLEDLFSPIRQLNSQTIVLFSSNSLIDNKGNYRVNYDSFLDKCNTNLSKNRNPISYLVCINKPEYLNIVNNYRGIDFDKDKSGLILTTEFFQEFIHRGNLIDKSIFYW